MTHSQDGMQLLIKINDVLTQVTVWMILENIILKYIRWFRLFSPCWSVNSMETESGSVASQGFREARMGVITKECRMTGNVKKYSKIACSNKGCTVLWINWKSIEVCIMLGQTPHMNYISVGLLKVTQEHKLRFHLQYSCLIPRT